MKLFVAGHSDSGAEYLGEGEQTWGERTVGWLEQQTGQPWELTGVRFAPMGSRAVNYLVGAVEKAEPDVVVIPFSAYVCTIATVSENVKARFGARAHGVFRRIETGFDRRTHGAPGGKHAGLVARKVARATLGSRTLATVDEVASIYEEVLHRLARMESVQVIAIADARFSEPTQKANPGIHAKIEQLYARVMPVAERHHFVTADLEGALRRAPDRSVFYTPDGVHTTAAFHATYFEVLKDVLPPVLARLPTTS